MATRQIPVALLDEFPVKCICVSHESTPTYRT